MKITQELLDRLTEEAKASPRLRVNYDLRNSAEDGSQRMLNAIEPGSVLPIHRHRKTSETMVCLRGKLVVEYYEEFTGGDGSSQGEAASSPLDSATRLVEEQDARKPSERGPRRADGAPRLVDGMPRLVETIELSPNGPVVALNIPAGQWHTVRSAETGTVILEMKNGAYEPLSEEDVLK